MPQFPHAKPSCKAMSCSVRKNYRDLWTHGDCFMFSDNELVCEHAGEMEVTNRKLLNNSVRWAKGIAITILVVARDSVAQAATIISKCACETKRLTASFATTTLQTHIVLQ